MVQLLKIMLMTGGNSLTTNPDPKTKGKVLNRLQSMFILCKLIFYKDVKNSVSYTYLEKVKIFSFSLFDLN